MKRERVLKALRRDIPNQVPRYFTLCPSQIEKFKRKTGREDYEEYFGFEVRFVSIRPTKLKTEFRSFIGEIPPRTWVDEWGVGHERRNINFHFEHLIHPLKGAKSIKEVENYPFPDIDADYRFRGLKDEVKELKRKDFAVVGSCCPLGGTLFWPAYKLRGMQELMMDFYLNPGLAEALLERVTELVGGMAEKMAGCELDIVHMADDLGSQRGLLLSAEMFRKFFKERLERIIQKAKEINPKVLILFHSDGAIEELIPDLIDVGIDILNPIQPECMDPAKIKRKYGNHLAFWGTVGTQTTMPFGTPNDVQRVVKERIKTVGEKGGLLIAPTHVIEPEVPWDNILAFVEAVEKFGEYQ